MSYINKENLLEQFNSLEQLARKRVYDTPTNSPAYERYSTQYYEREKALSIIKAQPTADVVEVRHGEWRKANDKYPRYVCTICNHLFNNKNYNYCPNCGAKMDGKKERAQ